MQVIEKDLRITRTGGIQRAEGHVYVEEEATQFTTSDSENISLVQGDWFADDSVPGSLLDDDENEAVEAMRLLRLKALQHQWDDDDEPASAS